MKETLAEARITELEVELKVAQGTIADLRDADKRAVKIAAEQANKQKAELEARLKEAEAELEVAGAAVWKYEAERDTAIERAEKAEADAARLRKAGWAYLRTEYDRPEELTADKDLPEVDWPARDFLSALRAEQPAGAEREGENDAQS